MLCGRSLPVFLSATLIPFKNVIVTDGLVATHNVYFGRSMALECKEIYMNAKKNGKLHRSF